jgi:hypothetical protein
VLRILGARGPPITKISGYIRLNLKVNTTTTYMQVQKLWSVGPCVIREQMLPKWERASLEQRKSLKITTSTVSGNSRRLK